MKTVAKLIIGVIVVVCKLINTAVPAKCAVSVLPEKLVLSKISELKSFLHQ